MLIAPVYSNSEQEEYVYLPKGSDWVDYWDKKVYQGDQTLNYDISDINKMPIFVKSGAIIPMQSKRLRILPEPEDTVYLEIYYGKNSSYTLYDDDGTSIEYQKGNYGKTEISCNYKNDLIEIKISALRGEFKNKPAERAYIINLNLINDVPKYVMLNDNKIKEDIIPGKNNKASWSYNKGDKIVQITNKESTSKDINIKVSYPKAQ